MISQSSLPNGRQSLFQRLVQGMVKPLQHWIDRVDVRQPHLAHRLCRLIPAQCPFERDIQMGSWQFHIPALCQLNPVYEQLVFLRFRALSYLADECGEDISPYC